MAILLALSSAALSGSGDFFGGFASRHGRVLAIVFMSNVAGAVSLFVLAPLFGGTLDTGTMFWGALAGISGALAVVALYTGFTHSSISVVSPTAALGGAAWPVLFDLVADQPPGPVVAAGIVLGLIAIWTISSGGSIADTEDVRAGILFGTLAGLGFGGLLICLSFASADSGIWAMLPARTVGAATLALIGLGLGRPLRPHRQSLLPGIGAGVLTVLGNGCFILATTKGSLAVVSVLAAMFPAATVLLARLFLGERLTLQRRIGLVIALVAIGLVAGG